MLNEISMCGISKQNVLAKLIQRARRLVWDEAPMTHRFAARAGGAGAAGAALAAPLLNSNIISSMGRGSAEPPKILLPYLQWPPHFSWASDAPVCS